MEIFLVDILNIENNVNDKDILIAALLIHAAKIDENYTDNEKKIIKKALVSLNEITADEATSSDDQRLRISATREKEDFLRVTLKNGPMTKTQIDFEAEKKGISGKPALTDRRR